jgi:hypothetical protein
MRLPLVELHTADALASAICITTAVIGVPDAIGAVASSGDPTQFS